MHGEFLPPILLGWIGNLPMIPLCAGALILAVLVFEACRRMRRARKDWRLGILGLRDGARFRVVDAMVHACWSGRKLSDARLERAHEIARTITDLDYTPEHIREAALRADRLILPMNFHWMGPGLSRGEKLVIFNSAVSVMLADGRPTPQDRSFLRVLTRGLGLNRADLSDLSKLVPQ